MLIDSDAFQWICSILIDLVASESFRLILIDHERFNWFSMILMHLDVFNGIFIDSDSSLKDSDL